MAKFEDVVSRVKDVAETAGRKTGELVELGKMKLKIADLRREIAGAHEGLGRLMYDSRKSGEPVDDMVDACIDHISALHAEIDELEERIMDSKNVVRCHGCGAFNENTAVFCNQCGAKID
ncbi:MAG: hypothetical protein IKU56_02360 [Clostridia bacterium]|nr:hypothetical protein [Clostridia bacterium]